MNKNKNLIPVWQTNPLYPELHVQLYPSIWFEHCPSCWQGLDVQESISEIYHYWSLFIQHVLFKLKTCIGLVGGHS